MRIHLAGVVAGVCAKAGNYHVDCCVKFQREVGKVGDDSKNKVIEPCMDRHALAPSDMKYRMVCQRVMCMTWLRYGIIMMMYAT